jgi:hypothetical protein
MASVASSEIQVDTPAGAAWVEKYLHPPSTTKAVYAGIPDLNGTPSVNLEYRLERKVAMSDTTAGNAIVMYFPPSIMRQGFAFEVNSSGVVDQFTKAFIKNTQISEQDFATNAESYRMAYRSSTVYQDSTGFNNNGMLYSAQFRPNVQTFNDQQLSEFTEAYGNHQGFDNLKECFVQPEDTYDVVYQQKPASKANDLNKLTNDMAKINVRRTAPKPHQPRLPSSGNVIQVISLGRIPITATDVMMRSPKAQARKAVEGAFVVHQFSEPTQSYKSLSRTYKNAAATEALAYSIFCVYEFEFNGMLYLSDFNSLDGGTHTTDFEWYEMTWGLLMYVPGATSAGQPEADLIVKTIFGLDVQPTSGSMFSAVSKDAPLYDQQALRLAAMMRQKMPDSMPAAANDFGSIIAAVTKWAPMIFNGIKSIFAPKATTETVKKEARKATEVAVSAAKTAAARAVKRETPVPPRPFVARPSRIPRPIRPYRGGARPAPQQSKIPRPVQRARGPVQGNLSSTPGMPYPNGNEQKYNGRPSGLNPEAREFVPRRN